jgi:hypothetical protein
MLGVVGFDLVPEALSQQPGELFGVPSVMLAAVLGFLTLRIVERSVAIHRGHEGEYAGHVHAPGLGIFAASALVAHRLLDGVPGDHWSPMTNDPWNQSSSRSQTGSYRLPKGATGSCVGAMRPAAPLGV